MSERILGIGTDLCTISRLEKAASSSSFLNHVCTSGEQEWLSSCGAVRAESLAAMFAAKEAASKALGTGFSQGVVPSQIEVIHNEYGAPQLVLHGKAQEIMHALGGNQMLLSLSHEKDLALAFVLLKGEA